MSLALHAAVGIVAGTVWMRPAAVARAVPSMTCLPGSAVHEERAWEVTETTPDELPPSLDATVPPPEPALSEIADEPFLELLPAKESPEHPVPPAAPALLPLRLAPRASQPTPAIVPPAPPAPPAQAPTAPASPPGPPAASAPSGPSVPGTLRPTRLPDPPYVPALAGVRVRLTVTLILRLADDGRVVDAQIEQSSGHAGFDKHARAWVLAHWRFEPPGRAVRTRIPAHYRP